MKQAMVVNKIKIIEKLIMTWKLETFNNNIPINGPMPAAKLVLNP
ncbi:hypothetical protein HMPREF9511_00022 [Enterococcus faecalis TX0630]|uniref:Uncharacterized protein n=1 Tax=Enterococcus faecalis TX0630 TaxID=749508 RepID=A0ABC9PBH9_ENTFL|nr:hypothetical protein HMPREF9511_00022 [Enterococcus faecalis TX0630]